MERIWVNKFLGGLNSDLDKAISPAESYLNANNLTLSNNNGFLSLVNIKGTTEVGTITSSFTGNVLAVYANKYTINSVENVECLTIFTAQSSGYFKIWCYDLDNNNIYELYQELFTSAFEATSPVVDAICYPENGLDIIYFTDGYNEIRKIRCKIDFPYSANFLTSKQISLNRRGTLGKIDLFNVTSGGSLASGTYQFVFRLFNETTKSYSKWTIPSTPIIVSRSVTGEQNQGGYGIGTSKKIEINITIPDYELSNWTHYQVAVFENTQVANVVNASGQKIVSLSGGTVFGEYRVYLYEYKDNTKLFDVPVEDIVVDLAAIKSVKTLQVKNNRLFGGDIEYWNRDYDNGDPVITGSVSTQSVGLKNDLELSQYRGHFRDEVYRYYVSYFDEYFNYSRPKKLDMSAITTYGLANGDVKFPSRKIAGYTLLDGSSNPRAIGLSCTIDNHPSWAKGFIILRAKRKKKIKFQTPFIPSSLVEGIEVIGTYPVETWYLNASGGRSKKTVSEGTPMNPLGTLMPKNFFHTAKKDMVRTSEDDAATKTQKGECKYTAIDAVNKSNSVYFAYPNTVWGGSYAFEVGDKYNVTDWAFLELSTGLYGSNSYELNTGNYIQTSVHGSFYATNIGNYYYSNSVSRSEPSLPTKEGELLSFKELDNISEGTTISNYSVEQFNNLNTGGVFYNSSPSTQRVGVFELKTPRQDDTIYGNTTVAGVNRMNSSDGTYVKDDFYELTEGDQTNIFVFDKVNYNTGDPVAILPIVNIVNDLGDDRYGAADDLHDMVYTGVTHVFNSTQLAQIAVDGSSAVGIEIWGGDCFVNLHQVKITDSHYGLINSEKLGAGTQLNADEVLRRWVNAFENKYEGVGGSNDGAGLISAPAPYKNVSQTISVMIESEVLTNIVDPVPYSYSSIDSKSVVSTPSSGEAKLRIPFSYGYNLNYSKESDQKAFVPFDENEDIVTKYKSRVVFSDQKVYQTDNQGFDIFRASNFKDLEETYGSISKLALDGDVLISVQESATAYLPIDAAIIETADSSSLAVRSGVVVDTPVYLSRQYGSQHTKSVITIDEGVFFADNNNQAIVTVSGKKIDFIHEKGAVSLFNSLLASDKPKDELFGLYDINRRQYWIQDKNNFCWVWDNRLGLWVSNYEFTDLEDGVYAYNNLYLIGRDQTSNLKIYTMYTGNPTQFMGVAKTPSVTFAINPEFEYAKTFDNINVYATDKLDTIDVETQIETGASGQSVTGIDIDINRREGNYRAQILRDSTGARLRGVQAEATIKWKTEPIQAFLSSVATKYRVSSRGI